MSRLSHFFAFSAAVLLIAAPWVVMSARWPVYIMGVASLTLAAIFYLSND